MTMYRELLPLVLARAFTDSLINFLLLVSRNLRLNAKLIYVECQLSCCGFVGCIAPVPSCVCCVG